VLNSFVVLGLLACCDDFSFFRRNSAMIVGELVFVNCFVQMLLSFNLIVWPFFGPFVFKMKTHFARGHLIA
jgi:hypothetical protein